ncbi:MAG: DUF1572 domain-containing protein [Chitinophagaceae bacterium]
MNIHSTRPLFVANRLREVLLSGTWIANTNFKEQILATTFKEAIFKIDSFNTIAALTYHIQYYVSGLIEVFKGGQLLISDRYSFDFSPIASEEDWNSLVSTFIKKAEEISILIEKLPDSILDEIFVDEKYGTYLRNIEGLIEHAYYHLGQVVMLRKMIAMFLKSA